MTYQDFWNMHLQMEEATADGHEGMAIFDFANNADDPIALRVKVTQEAAECIARIFGDEVVETDEEEALEGMSQLGCGPVLNAAYWSDNISAYPIFNNGDINLIGPNGDIEGTGATQSAYGTERTGELEVAFQNEKDKAYQSNNKSRTPVFKETDISLAYSPSYDGTYLHIDAKWLSSTDEKGKIKEYDNIRLSIDAEQFAKITLDAIETARMEQENKRNRPGK